MELDLSRDTWGTGFHSHLPKHSVPLLRRIQVVHSQPRFSNIARQKRSVWVTKAILSCSRPRACPWHAEPRQCSIYRTRHLAVVGSFALIALALLSIALFGLHNCVSFTLIALTLFASLVFSRYEFSRSRQSDR